MAVYATELWPTPTITGNNNRKGISPKSGDGLGTALRKTAGQPVQESASTLGNRPASLPNINPRWIETLMGVPVGWTMPSYRSPESMRSGSSETASCPRKPTTPSSPLLADWPI